MPLVLLELLVVLEVLDLLELLVLLELWYILKFIIETRLNRVFSSQWLNHVSQGNALSTELFRVPISR